MTILLIDVGNTRTHAVLAEERAFVARADWTTQRPGEAADRPPPLLKGKALDRIRIASVRPSVRDAIAAALRLPGWPEPKFFGTDLPVPIPNRTREPGAVGVDRLLVALAAHRRARGAAVAVGVGSAVTLNVVSPAGEFLGGAIAPGLPAAARALAQVCEQLPEVPPAAPTSVIGRTTVEAIQAGLVAGTAGLIEGLLRRTLEELGRPARVFATGGDAALLAPLVPRIEEVLPDLVFEGMLMADGGPDLRFEI